MAYVAGAGGVSSGGKAAPGTVRLRAALPSCTLAFIPSGTPSAAPASTNWPGKRKTWKNFLKIF
jgi:hypothetical protein